MNINSNNEAKYPSHYFIVAKHNKYLEPKAYWNTIVFFALDQLL